MLIIGFSHFNDDAVDDFYSQEVLLGQIVKCCQPNLDLVLEVGLFLLAAPFNQGLAHFDLQLLGIRDNANLVDHLPYDLGGPGFGEDVKGVHLIDDELEDLLRGVISAVECSEQLEALLLQSQFCLRHLRLSVGKYGKKRFLVKRWVILLMSLGHFELLLNRCRLLLAD